MASYTARGGRLAGARWAWGAAPLELPLHCLLGRLLGLLFSLRPQGGGVGWGGGSGLEHGSGASGAPPPLEQGRLSPGRPTSPPVTMCPGVGLIQPGAGLMWGLREELI